MNHVKHAHMCVMNHVKHARMHNVTGVRNLVMNKNRLHLNLRERGRICMIGIDNNRMLFLDVKKNVTKSYALTNNGSTLREKTHNLVKHLEKKKHNLVKHLEKICMIDL